MKQKDIYECPDCQGGKKCMKHHEYNTDKYVIIPPDEKRKKIMALEKENKALFEALWHCGIRQEQATAEAGIKYITPASIFEQIDFEKFNRIGKATGFKLTWLADTIRQSKEKCNDKLNTRRTG